MWIALLNDEFWWWPRAFPPEHWILFSGMFEILLWNMFYNANYPPELHNVSSRVQKLAPKEWVWIQHRHLWNNSVVSQNIRAKFDSVRERQFDIDCLTKFIITFTCRLWRIRVKYLYTVCSERVETRFRFSLVWYKYAMQINCKSVHKKVRKLC